jgi:hypothetical protein
MEFHFFLEISPLYVFQNQRFRTPRVMLETAHDNGKKAFFSVGDGGV